MFFLKKRTVEFPMKVKIFRMFLSIRPICLIHLKIMIRKALVANKYVSCFLLFKISAIDWLCSNWHNIVALPMKTSTAQSFKLVLCNMQRTLKKEFS